MGPTFWLMCALVTVAALSFVAVVVWIDARKDERKQFYRHETVRKIAESGSSTAAVEYLRETDRLALRRRRSELKLGGLITGAAGLGLMVFLGALLSGSYNFALRDVYLVGLIPLLIGVVLFGYAQWAMRED